MARGVTGNLRPDAVPKNLLIRAIRIGLAKDLDELLAVVRTSVPFTHPYFNRRVDQTLFRINRERLVDMHVIACRTCTDSGMIAVPERCTACAGTGCPLCKQGQVFVKQACPDCRLSASQN